MLYREGGAAYAVFIYQNSSSWPFLLLYRNIIINLFLPFSWEHFRFSHFFFAVKNSLITVMGRMCNRVFFIVYGIIYSSRLLRLGCHCNARRFYLFYKFVITIGFFFSCRSSFLMVTVITSLNLRKTVRFFEFMVIFFIV